MTTTSPVPAYQKISEVISYLFKDGFTVEHIAQLLNSRYPATFYWGGNVARGTQCIKIEDEDSDEYVTIWQCLPKPQASSPQIANTVSRGTISTSDL